MHSCFQVKFAFSLHCCADLSLNRLSPDAFIPVLYFFSWCNKCGISVKPRFKLSLLNTNFSKPAGFT